MRKGLLLGIVVLLAGVAAPAQAHPTDGARTNATYYNDASLPAADPYVLHDPRSGYYYAYSTEGADDGFYFGMYRSADLATWEKVPGGALPKDDPRQWGNDWFWAPEVYYNARTGNYFLFYAARSDANAQSWFGYASFEEPCKIGVAVSRSPAGPFHNIASRPIDYNPYDPDYHDVNLLMGPDQKKPPATLQEGESAPLGTYIPTIDPDVFFDDDGHIYLYFSRNAYRNWVWDTDLGKYIEESNIYAVELTSRWWKDPGATTMPSIAPSYRGANASSGGPPGPRRDGWVRILDYDHDKQAWENADVNDYALSGGEKKDRRWEEGSSTLKVRYGAGGRKSAYYLTYSANNWETPQYGVGYATATSPLGPFRKAATNPILSQNAQIGMYSTGHGSFALSPDGRELYYVHHGRPAPDDPQRRLYTDRALLGPALDAAGFPRLGIDQATSDRPIPSGAAPFRLHSSARRLVLQVGGERRVSWEVDSAEGVPLALSNPLNRVGVEVGNPAVASVVGGDADGATVVAHAAGRTTVTLTYQRRSSTGAYYDVDRVRTRVKVTVMP
jgi:GH43 family beta-xylosidase